MDAFSVSPSGALRRVALLALSLLALSLLLVPVVTAQDRIRNGAPDDVLIQNATVLTITNGTLDGADVLVEDGTIAAVGDDLRAPSGIPTVDATGQYLMPGIIDAHSHIAISSVNEATHPVTAEVGVGDVLDPYDITLYRALAGGVTTSHVMHGSANAIGGRNETIKHRYGMTDPEALRFEGAPRTIKFALGENPTRVHGEGRDIPPRTRMGVEQVIRDALAQAERYAAHKAAYDAGERSAPPPHSERMEVLAGVLSGDVQVHCHSYRAERYARIDSARTANAADASMPEYVPEMKALLPVVRGEMPILVKATKAADISSALEWGNERGLLDQMILSGAQEG